MKNEMTAKTILVVDDEKDIVDLIAYHLEREGFNVIRAYDGRTALELVQTGKPHLVLLDLLLPEIKGLDVCRALRKNQATQHLPIIMITAISDTADRILGLEIGADDYITKPFHVRELIARVGAVLRREEQHHETEKGESLSIGGIRIDFGTYRVTVDDRQIDLTSRESKLPQSITSDFNFTPRLYGQKNGAGRMIVMKNSLNESFMHSVHHARGL